LIDLRIILSLILPPARAARGLLWASAMAQKEWVSPDSKFCRWCQKRFANEAVFNGHLTGKKHIKALEAGGRKAEADLIRRKIQDAKAREQSKQAQAEAAEKTKKRKQEEEDAGVDAQGAAKQAKSSSTPAPASADLADGGADGGGTAAAAPGTDLAASAAAAAKGEVADVKVDLADKQQMELAMAYASGRAKPMVNMAVNEKWWEGTAHSTGNPGTASALSNGQEITAGNRNTQKPERPTVGAGSGNKDWQCPGNYAQVGGARECGEWNYGNADKCRKCNTLRRLY
jgi:hypothetical protein